MIIVICLIASGILILGAWAMKTKDRKGKE